MDALPAISDALLPREVRAGSTADKQAYKAALGFEQVLLGELVKEMAPVAHRRPARRRRLRRADAGAHRAPAGSASRPSSTRP